MKPKEVYLSLFAFTVMMLCVPSLNYASAKDIFEKSYSMDRDGRVYLQNVSGDIVVKGWGKDQVRIKAIHAGGPKKDLAEVVHITQTNGNIRITTRSDDSFSLFRPGRVSVYYELLVPDSTHLKVETASGNAEIHDFSGSLESRTVSGDIKITAARSSVKCKTVSGDIYLEKIMGDTEVKTTSGEVKIQDLKGSFEGESVSGDMDLKKIMGNADLKTTSGEVMVQDLKGSFEAESVSGDIDVKSFSQAEEIEIETVSGDISVEGILVPNGSYSLVSHSGTVTLVVPSESDFELQIKTTSGDIDRDFDLKGYARSRLHLFQGIVGKGGSTLSISTFSGDIHINKR